MSIQPTRELFGPEPGRPGSEPGERWILTRSQLCDLLGLSPQRVHQLEKSEGMPKLGHNKFDAAACVQWYIAFWRERANDSKAAKDTAEHRRYQQAKAARAELELQRAAGELAPMRTVVRLFNELASMFVGALDDLPSRFAVELASITEPSKIEEILDNERRRLRAAIAGRVESLESDLDDRGDRSTAA